MAGGVYWSQPGPASATGVAVSGNDDFANAWAVSSLPFVGKQNTSGMTTQTGEPTSPPPECAGPLSWGASVWYSHTATASDVVLVGDTAGSDYNIVVAAYTGTAVNGLTFIACDSGFGGVPAQIKLPVVAGETYHFQVSGVTGVGTATGNLSLSLFIQPTPTPCPTAGCPTATPITAAAEMSLNVKSPGASCDDPNKPSICFVDAGSEFTLSVATNRIPAGGYRGFQTLIVYGSLKYKATGDVADEFVSPDMLDGPRSPQAPTGQEGAVAHGAFGLLSMHTGSIVQIALNCSANIKTFKIELVPFSITPLGAVFVNADGSTTTTPDVGEPLQINCAVDDSDLDGCTNAQELAPKSNAALGGGRDPLYFWDFFDVWTHPFDQPTAWVRDKVINVPGDIIGVISRFGPGTAQSKEDALAAALTPPASSSGYHAAFDRGPVIGPNNWNRAPADGAINIPDDILGVAVQFGHNCSGA